MSQLGFLRHMQAKPVADRVRLERIQKTCSAIVDVLSPNEIYLFGSAVSCETFDEESDIDCLAVLSSEAQASRWWKSFGKIRRQLGWPLDLVCLSQDEFARKKNLGGVAFVAFHEGILLYSR
ncbi:MAG: nucleotidyltransferase domain-containing protein [Pseudomonadota bacterium]